MKKNFLEFGIKEVTPWDSPGTECVYARFLLKEDRDAFLKQERGRLGNSKFRHVPVRFRRPEDT